jgi:hypothetical protein
LNSIYFGNHTSPFVGAADDAEEDEIVIYARGDDVGEDDEGTYVDDDLTTPEAERTSIYLPLIRSDE